MAFLLTLFLLGNCQISTAQSIDRLLQEAKEAYEAEKYIQAETIARQAIATESNNARAYNYLGIILRQQEKVEEAIDAYRRAISLNPYEATAYYNLGNALSEKNQLDEAIAKYREAIELDPTHADAYSKLGDVLVEKKQPEEAIAAYRQAIQHDPNNAIRYNNLGDALRRQNQLDKAIEAYRRASKIDFNPLFRANLESTQKEQQRIEQAISAYRRAVERNPNSAVAYTDLGDAYQKEHQFDEAIENYRKAIRLNPNFARPHVGLGDVFRQQNQLDDAIAAYRQAIAIDPNNALAYIGLGNALRDKQELDKAVDAYRDSINIDPNNSRAYYNLGLILSHQSQLEEAIATYNQALNLPDQNIIGLPASIHVLTRNALGLALQEQGDLEAAIVEFKEAQYLEPSLVSTQTNLSEAQRENKRLVSLHETRYLPNDDWTSIKRSVVKIIAESPSSNLSYEEGTGWVIKREGDIAWIVTNRHVVSNDDDDIEQHTNISLEIYMGDLPEHLKKPRVTCEIDFIETQPNSLDIALLKVTGLPSDIKPLPVSQEPIKDGTNISVVGQTATPIFNGGDLSWIWKDWQVQTSEINLGKERYLTIEARKLASGSSGSPVVLKKGDKNLVVGIIFQIVTPKQLDILNDIPVTRAEGFGVAYPIVSVIQKLKTQGLI
ncbi:MAG: tetratricopeptide repeat protein [Spirulina sp.]